VVAGDMPIRSAISWLVRDWSRHSRSIRQRAGCARAFSSSIEACLFNRGEPSPRTPAVSLAPVGIRTL